MEVPQRDPGAEPLSWCPLYTARPILIITGDAGVEWREITACVDHPPQLTVLTDVADRRGRA